MEKKKNKFCMALASVSILALCGLAFVGCSTSSGDGSTPTDTTQLDYLGGGGTGTTPTEVDTSSVNSSVLTKVGGIDLDSDSVNTTYDEATITQLGSGDTITEAGDYLLSGDYDTIEITATKDSVVHLFLNNANISSSEYSAIKKSDDSIKLIITVLDGTTNSITSSAESCNALHVKGQLVINGTGTLNVTASGSDVSGIKVSKTCTILDSTVNISMTKHGISAETIMSENASITINSSSQDAKDGLHSECDFDNKKGKTYDFSFDTGYVYLKNVDFLANVSGDGIQADTFVYIDGGNTEITATGQFVPYSSANLTTYSLTSDDFRFIKSGTAYQKVASDAQGSLSNRYALVQSSKGIKVGEIEYDTDGDDEDDAVISTGGYCVYINDGEFTLTTSDDAIHTNCGNVIIKGGNFTINTNDDGITSDILTQIDGGTINIESSFEGIEGAYVKITGGEINIVSTDDGINAASDDTSISEYIIISGGTVVVDASGDGLDSNGSILISGGNVKVCGPTSNGDGALDSETGILVNGGTLVAYSSLGMVETPAKNSSQKVISYGQRSYIASGTTITLKDSAGTEIISFETNKTCGSVIISCPELQEGSSYSLYVGSQLVSTFTISSTITTLGANNNFGGGEMGGGGNQPGRPSR